MNGLLVRVGADSTPAGGHWNAPVDSLDGRFVYVAIPETVPQRPPLATPFTALTPALTRLHVPLPPALTGRAVHQDPDFRHLTYGDHGMRARQLATHLRPGDVVVFYAGLRDVRESRGLVYAIVGLFVVRDVCRVADLPQSRWGQDAHTRRVAPNPDDVIVRGRAKLSGRLARCLPIGSYRNRSYRVLPQLLRAWGGVGVHDGYLQRSARFPPLTDAARFYRWFLAQGVKLQRRNG